MELIKEDGNWKRADLSPLVSADFEEHVVPDHVRVRGPYLSDAAHRPVHEVVEIFDWEKRFWHIKLRSCFHDAEQSIPTHYRRS